MPRVRKKVRRLPPLCGVTASEQPFRCNDRAEAYDSGEEQCGGTMAVDGFCDGDMTGDNDLAILADGAGSEDWEVPPKV